MHAVTAAIAAPYFRLGALEIGPMTFQGFGLLVGVGFIVGWLIARHFGAKREFDPDLYDIALLVIAPSALVFGHLGQALYHPEKVLEDPLYLLRVTDGIASYGGFFGCAAAAWVFARWKGLPFVRFGVPLILGTVVGFGIGRLGCFGVHDHVGVLVSEGPAVARSLIGWAAVEFPADDATIKALGATPGLRYDLGLVDAAVMVILAVGGWALIRRPERDGVFLAFVCCGYGLLRLAQEPLRIGDTRFSLLGLDWTPAQYSSVVLIALGVYAWAVLRRGSTAR